MSTREELAALHAKHRRQTRGSLEKYRDNYPMPEDFAAADVTLAGMEDLQVRIDKVLVAHYSVDSSDNPRLNKPFCDGCNETWPCTTYKILKGVDA